MNKSTEKNIEFLLNVYQKIKAKINKLLIKNDTCLLCNDKRPRIWYNDSSYQVLQLIYINHFKELPIRRAIKRKCGNVCYNPDHFIFQTSDIDYYGAWIRLSSKGIRDNNTGCLLWNGPKDKDGYGDGSFNGKTEHIHKISYKIKIQNTTIQKIDENDHKLCIRHTCNNRNCYEPSHLELGTINENNYEDRIKHGTLLRGEKNPSSNITEELAQKIKHSKYPINHVQYKSVPERAKLFGVTEATIYHIDYNTSWTHIPDRDGNIIKRPKVKKPQSDKWTSEMFQKVREKIKNNHTKIENTDCWKWSLGLDKGGYGTISINSCRKKAHVASCEAKYGYNKPKNQVTRHICNNTWCVNPDHLEFGTPIQNNIDAVNNESNKNNTKLQVVKEIRETYKKDGLTSKERSVKYNVTRKVLYDIETGRTFKYI